MVGPLSVQLAARCGMSAHPRRAQSQRPAEARDGSPAGVARVLADAGRLLAGVLAEGELVACADGVARGGFAGVRRGAGAAAPMRCPVRWVTPGRSAMEPDNTWEP